MEFETASDRRLRFRDFFAARAMPLRRRYDDIRRLVLDDHDKDLTMKWPIIFALLTGLFWGTYGPALGIARAAEGNNPFKPYLMIGLAYLVWAVIGGVAGIRYTNVDARYSFNGASWGFIAGSLGAFGALTLTLAMFTFAKGVKPMPQVVMPIVFGTAVTVSAITSVLLTRAQASPWLYVGIVGMAVCIVIVASNTPHAAPHKPKSDGDAHGTPPAVSSPSST